MILKFIFAAIGTLGFGMAFNSSYNKLIYILIGGFLNYFSYYVTYYYSKNVFLASLVCASVTYIYSNVLARLTKCPSVVYVLTGLIPVVPGSSLFYMMQALVLDDLSLAYHHMLITVLTILGIATGIALFSMLHNLFKNIIKS